VTNFDKTDTLCSLVSFFSAKQFLQNVFQATNSVRSVAVLSTATAQCCILSNLESYSVSIRVSNGTRFSCPATKGQKSLSRDFSCCSCPGTKGQRDKETFFVPGQRDNGTSFPRLSRDVPSLGNPSFYVLRCMECLILRIIMKVQ
jgi:hypothetical protein